MRLRNLSGAEEALARSVFLHYLPYRHIYISDVLGLGGAPFTFRLMVRFIINLGPAAFNDGADSTTYWQETLIHELTHVWQSQRHWFPWLYVAQSVIAQCGAILKTRDRNSAYIYTPGALWETYNVEQQASIVADWFIRGRSPHDPCYPYIVNRICNGNHPAGRRDL
jgi:hypothetical protein